MAEAPLIGWDIGGAHVKACLMQRGQVLDVAEWPCPLWQGLPHLADALAAGLRRWPLPAPAIHAVTMTGEMVDLFAHREDGVRRLAGLLDETLGRSGAAVHFFAAQAGEGGETGWCRLADVPGRWAQIASANWLATARHCALWLRDGVLVDIGSTTTDLIPFCGGRVAGRSRSDADRLASGELVYQGVVRTPLCALAPRIALGGTAYNVMNEFFATTADVYRLLGQLNPAHDLHPSADQGDKTLASTRQRLARMVGLDARDAPEAQWLVCAQAWRRAQLDELQGQLARVLAAHAVPAAAPLVSAGCGAFLADALAQATGRRVLNYGRELATIAPDAAAGTADWAQVCAPSVAVAALASAELA